MLFFPAFFYRCMVLHLPHHPRQKGRNHTLHHLFQSFTKSDLMYFLNAFPICPLFSVPTGTFCLNQCQSLKCSHGSMPSADIANNLLL